MLIARERSNAKYLRDGVDGANKHALCLSTEIAEVLVDEQQEDLEYQYNDGIPHCMER